MDSSIDNKANYNSITDIKLYLISDLQNIVYSYISLEELIKQNLDDLKFADKLVQQYFFELPTLEEL